MAVMYGIIQLVLGLWISIRVVKYDVSLSMMVLMII